MKILIIEDDYVSYNIFKTFLQHYGTCHNATTGKDAIDIYNNALFSGNAYDLILIDIILPDMNGQEILKLIRFEEERRSLFLERENFIPPRAKYFSIFISIQNQLSPIPEFLSFLLNSYSGRP